MRIPKDELDEYPVACLTGRVYRLLDTRFCVKQVLTQAERDELNYIMDELHSRVVQVLADPLPPEPTPEERAERYD